VHLFRVLRRGRPSKEALAPRKTTAGGNSTRLHGTSAVDVFAFRVTLRLTHNSKSDNGQLSTHRPVDVQPAQGKTQDLSLACTTFGAR
jgi:hypothetical protein